MERKKYESDLGTALRVSECSMILELAEVLRGVLEGEQKEDSERTRVDHVVTAHPHGVRLSIKGNGASKRRAGATEGGELLRCEECTRVRCIEYDSKNEDSDGGCCKDPRGLASDSEPEESATVLESL